MANFRPRKVEEGETMAEYLRKKQEFQLEQTGETGITLPSQNKPPKRNIRNEYLGEEERQARKDIEKYGVAEPRTQEEIREDLREAAQGRIDYIRTQYEEEIGEAEERGEEMERRTRALSVAAGLAGSPFATARAKETEKKTQEQVETIKAERSAKIEQVLGNVEQRAIEMAQKEKQRAFEAAEVRLERIEERQAEQKQDARADIAILAKDAEVSLNTVKTRDPELYQRLMNQAGFDNELLMDSYWEWKAPEEVTPDWQSQQFIEGEDGTAKFVRYGIDQNGQWIEKEYETGIPNEQIADKTGTKWDHQVTKDGRMFFFPEDATAEEMANKSYFYGEKGQFGAVEGAEEEGLFSVGEESKLMSLGLSGGEIGALEKNIRNYGWDTVKEQEPLTEEQKSALENILKGVEEPLEEDEKSDFESLWDESEGVRDFIKKAKDNNKDRTSIRTWLDNNEDKHNLTIGSIEDELTEVFGEEEEEVTEGEIQMTAEDLVASEYAPSWRLSRARELKGAKVNAKDRIDNLKAPDGTITIDEVEYDAEKLKNKIDAILDVERIKGLWKETYKGE